MSDIRPYIGPALKEDLGAIYAIQALAAGTASPEQQKHALNFIMYSIAELNLISYRPGGEEGSRDSAFAEGKRFVGHEIRKRIDVQISVLQQQPKEQENVRTRRSK